MKKMKFGFIILIALFAVLFSCENPFLMEPQIPFGSGNKGGAVEGLTATHGEKRSIALSWDIDSSAALYYVYKAASPLDVFIRCGETTTNQFAVNVPPGSTVYYRVSYVSHAGLESAQSVYVKGTSLAQPVISDITDIDESAAAVTWYMDNVSDDTYRNNLLYTVYCYNGNTQVAQLALDGLELTENKALFTGLNANTRYEYQVEAYLRSDQSISERSDLMDAATARRFRPGPAFRPRAARGTAIDKIDITFELPDMVDIALGDNMYDPKPVYFVISKRQYSEHQSNDYQIVCSYFGSISTTAISKGGKTFDGYAPGNLVTWTDSSGIRRGVKYEYQIQSYVDDTLKVISSDASKASVVGWALGEATLNFGRIEYTRHEDEAIDAFVAAKLPLVFTFDPLEEEYDYELVEEIEPLGDGVSNDPDSNISRPLDFTYDEICAHIPQMDLTGKTTQENAGRGLYSYKVNIKLNDNVIDTIETFDKREVSENTKPIIVEGFSVQDGYTDKFILKWHYFSNRKYVIEASDDRSTWNPIGVVNENPAGEEDETNNENFTWDALGYSPDETKYFRIQPFRDIGGGNFNFGQWVSAPSASHTLGVPKLSLEDNEPSYSAITPAWTEANKADHYRIMYKYEDTGWQEAVTVGINDLIDDGKGNLKYPFRPDGYNEVTQSGKEIQIRIDALNEGLRAGGGEISTSSIEDARTKLVGPALLDLSVSRASSALQIDVSWNKVDGAAGYYVFRRQFNMNNTAEEIADAVVYYVPAQLSVSNNIKGKDLQEISGAKQDTGTVKARVSFADSKFTLNDDYMPDIDYNGLYSSHTQAYKNQQNDIAAGYPYRYYVVPVLADNQITANMFTYQNAAISSYAISENNSPIVYSGAAAFEKEGFVIGFGYDVTATKGTYRSSSSSDTSDGIRISWIKPPLLEGEVTYSLYRRATGRSWTTLRENTGDLAYVDDPGITYNDDGSSLAYEYAVGITNSHGSSDPKTNQRFIDRCYTQTDEKGLSKMLGFRLGMVQMRGVSREELRVGNEFAEEVRWRSSGIQNNAQPGNAVWGIDGYEIWVMNRNIDGSWHSIADIPQPVNQIDQSAMVTNATGLLKVLRDYKHFFKVRSYVLDGSDKVYSPDPTTGANAWTYQYRWGPTAAAHITAGEQMENDYVKWGARQISPEEFIKITSLYMANGLDLSPGNDWTYTAGGTRENNANGAGESGSMAAKSPGLFDGSEMDLTFKNLKRFLPTRAGEEITFLTLNGVLWAYTNLSGRYPARYGDRGWIDVIGPWDTDLYTGKIRIGPGHDLEWDRSEPVSGQSVPYGYIYIQYPSANMTIRHPSDNQSTGALCEMIRYQGKWTALPYTSYVTGQSAAWGDMRFAKWEEWQ